MDKITINNQGVNSIQAYIEYKKIVGNDDNGKLMSEKQFEEYKKKVAKSRKNHLYVYWVNCEGAECKAIGPESMCFCNHRFKAHDFDSVKDKKVKCKNSGCKCKLYEYIPVYGANDVKCLCHHSYREHDLMTRKCKRQKCKCNGFGSKFNCNCNYSYNDHKTVIQTREERMQSGKPVDPGWFGENLIAGAGGLSSFGTMVNDVYEQEVQALQNQPGEKKMVISNGKPHVNNAIDKNKIDYSNSVPNNQLLSCYTLSQTPCIYFQK